MKKYDIIILAVLLIVVAIIMAFGVVYSMPDEMIYGDHWNCGYINATTNLSTIRDCYRD